MKTQHVEIKDLQKLVDHGLITHEEADAYPTRGTSTSTKEEVIQTVEKAKKPPSEWTTKP